MFSVFPLSWAASQGEYFIEIFLNLSESFFLPPGQHLKVNPLHPDNNIRLSISLSSHSYTDSSPVLWYWTSPSSGSSSGLSYQHSKYGLSYLHSGTFRVSPTFTWPPPIDVQSLLWTNSSSASPSTFLRWAHIILLEIRFTQDLWGSCVMFSEGGMREKSKLFLEIKMMFAGGVSLR